MIFKSSWLRVRTSNLFDSGLSGLENKMQDFRYLYDVSTLSFNREACIGCGMCEIVCPHGVFKVENKKAGVVDKNGCMECGACAKNCPSEAINVIPGVGCAAYIIQTWIIGKNGNSRGIAKCC